MNRGSGSIPRGAERPTAPSAATRSSYDALPDVRDGLTGEERVVLYVLHETQRERRGRSVPTTMLWGRVCEHFYISPEDLSALLARLGAMQASKDLERLP